MEGSIGVRRLADGAGVQEAAHGNPLLMLEGTADGARAAWSAPGGFAFVGPTYGGPGWWLTATTLATTTTTTTTTTDKTDEADTIRALVDTALADSDDKLVGLTVPRGVPLSQWGVAADDVNEWDLMRVGIDAAPPVQPRENLITPLEDLTRLQEFLDQVSPTHSMSANDPQVRVWAGVVENGVLLAVGALVERPSGAAYLASIATAEKARGQGFGSAVTAYLTRRAFASGAPECILAHYHPNESARRIYLRLGYRTTHQCSSAEFGR